GTIQPPSSSRSAGRGGVPCPRFVIMPLLVSIQPLSMTASGVTNEAPAITTLMSEHVTVDGYEPRHRFPVPRPDDVWEWRLRVRTDSRATRCVRPGHRDATRTAAARSFVAG